MGFRIAVVGATGALGREILAILAEQQEDGSFPLDDVVAIASSASLGQEISFGEEETLKVHNIEGFDFASVDIALFAAGDAVSRAHARRAALTKCLVVDASTAFRMEPGVPLVAFEANPHHLEQFDRHYIISTPGALACQVALCLKPLHDAFHIRRVVISAALATSGSGREAMDELFRQTRGIYVNEPPNDTREVFPKQIAFNLIPQAGNFVEDGATSEEQALQVELRKMLDPDLAVQANCCHAPVFIGHSAWLTIETDSPVTEQAAREVLRQAPGITVIDHRVEEGYVTPAETAGEDAVYVSRIRRDSSVEHGLSLWCVADNLRKTSALNVVQVAGYVAQTFEL